MPGTIDPRSQLRQHFGFREFLKGQESVIDALLGGRDAKRERDFAKLRRMLDYVDHVVYTDRTLRELAARMPKTQAELLEVAGIGPAKARQYGTETLAVIRKLSEKKA